MGGGSVATSKEELASAITADQIQDLIAERKGVGATSCEVILENGKRFLVCVFPPL